MEKDLVVVGLDDDVGRFHQGRFQLRSYSSLRFVVVLAITVGLVNEPPSHDGTGLPQF